MVKKRKEYQKLPGIKKGFLVGKYTLWQGSDHLLHIYSRMGVEDYKRFYFNDIQAIITRKTAVAKVQNFLLGFFLAVFIVLTILIEGRWSAFCGIVAGLILIFLWFNLLRGTTCETKLMTAVQTEKLHSLHRFKNTFKVLDRLRRLIEQSQGRFNPDHLKQK
jgi:hypothetical protein